MSRAPLHRLSLACLMAGAAIGASTRGLAASPHTPAQCAPACPSKVLVTPGAANSAGSLRFQEIFATQPGGQRAYVLLGSGFFRALSAGDPGRFVSGWLAAHPKASFTPVSTMTFTSTRSRARSEITYIWIEDGKQALNVDLVRQGVFAGTTMLDMVDNARGLDRLLQGDPRLADARAQIEQERAAAPQDRSERLIPEDDYRARMVRVEAAEKAARTEKLGIWSDEMKSQREAEGLS